MRRWQIDQSFRRLRHIAVIVAFRHQGTTNGQRRCSTRLNLFAFPMPFVKTAGNRRAEKSVPFFDFPNRGAHSVSAGLFQQIVGENSFPVHRLKIEPAHARRQLQAHRKCLRIGSFGRFDYTGYALVCCSDEDNGRLKHLLLDLLAEFQPAGFEEMLVVREIADTIWRKNRFKTGEVRLLEAYSYSEFGTGEFKKGDVGTAMAQEAAAYGTIPSCLAAENLLDPRLWKLFDRLKKLQKKRQKALAAIPAVISEKI